jgi:D-alanyl-D-alanine carboxypeptidase/D-alanyl-D-alanine-endopeptidase (penicillin-binding protein 4)
MRLRAPIALLLLGLVSGAAPAAAAGPDLAARTPIAAPGAPLAATRALSAAELRTKVGAAMDDAGGTSGAWIYDVDAGGDGLLYAEQPSRRLIPASNQKLFTTAAFLDRLRPDARLETRVFVRGRLTGAERAVVAGDLVLVGDGDPAFGTARFARSHDQPLTRVADLAADLARAGIERVKGRILADDSIFDRERRSGEYLSPLSGLSFNNGYDGGDYARTPEFVAAKALRSALRKRGVRVGSGTGRANLTRAALRRDPLASVGSPPVAKLIEETNVPSNNFFAEMLLKRLAAEGGKRGTRKRGAERVEAFANRVGSGIQASDGSGLSRKNRVSPQEVGKLLVAMARDERDAAAYRNSLPVAGREGTLAERMRGTAAEGACAAKTGTLNGVSALSGYCRASGHTIAFSVLNNGVSVDAAQRAQDRIAAAIARYGA